MIPFDLVNNDYAKGCMAMTGSWTSMPMTEKGVISREDLAAFQEQEGYSVCCSYQEKPDPEPHVSGFCGVQGTFLDPTIQSRINR